MPVLYMYGNQNCWSLHPQINVEAPKIAEPFTGFVFSINAYHICQGKLHLTSFYGKKINTTDSHYNMAQYNMILRKAQQLRR